MKLVDLVYVWKTGIYNTRINELKNLKNVKIVGLHAHFSTRQRSVETYSKITQGLCNAIKENQLTDIEYIDIGGGISGEVPKSLRDHAPTFDEYAEAVCSIMNNEFSEYRKQTDINFRAWNIYGC